MDYVDFNLYDRSDRARTGTINMLLRDTSENGGSIKIHPDYNPEILDMDFALILLENPIYSIHPVTLNDMAEVPSDGDKLFVAGWGTLAELVPPFDNTFDYSKDIPDVPNYFEPTYLPNDECVGRDEWADNIITENKLCTLGDKVDKEDAWNPRYNREGFCRGDSGKRIGC